MARETGGEARLGLPFIKISQDVQFADLGRQVQGFSVFLQAQIKSVTENLVKSGVTKAREKLRSSVTGWGEGRMAGNYFGVSFAPYGRTAGREETGFMYDSLSWSVNLAPSGKTMWRGTFGWDDAALSKAPYIPYQEQGFYSTGAFDPEATLASGIAKFTSGKEKWVEGAGSIPFARRSIERRAAAAYSAARNEAIKLFNQAGFKGDPGKYADVKPSGRDSARDVRYGRREEDGSQFIKRMTKGAGSLLRT